MTAATTIRETLLEMTATNGTALNFATLNDKRYAIVRDGEIVDVRESDDASLGQALRAYLKLSEKCGGARHRYPLVESCWHPHTG